MMREVKKGYNHSLGQFELTRLSLTFLNGNPFIQRQFAKFIPHLPFTYKLT